MNDTSYASPFSWRYGRPALRDPKRDGNAEPHGDGLSEPRLKIYETSALPEPGPGEVRVRLRVSGINPTDWKARQGATGIAPVGT